MKTETKIKIIVYGFYSALFALAFYIGLYQFHFPIIGAFLLGLVGVMVYPLFEIIRCWVHEKSSSRKEKK